MTQTVPDTSELFKAIHNSKYNSNIDEIKRLIAAGVDVNGVEHGGTPLHTAVLYVRLPEIIVLLIDAGADVNARSILGWTPLHLAVYCKEVELVKLLLDAGADKNIKNNEGKTALDIHRDEIFELLNC